MSVRGFANCTRKIRIFGEESSVISPHSARITGNGILDQFDPRLGFSARFDGGEWFAHDLVHHAVFGLVKSPNSSQQSSNIPAKWAPFDPKGHRRGFSAHRNPLLNRAIL